DSGTGLDHEVAAVGDGAGDGVGHGELLRPGLVVAQPAGDGAAGAEDGCVRHAAIVAESRGPGKGRGAAPAPALSTGQLSWDDRSRPGPCQITVSEGQTPVYFGEFAEAVELGRQSRDSEPLYQPRLQNDHWRLAIARPEELAISRRFARVEPLADGRVMLCNL